MATCDRQQPGWHHLGGQQVAERAGQPFAVIRPTVVPSWFVLTLSLLGMSSPLLAEPVVVPGAVRVPAPVADPTPPPAAAPQPGAVPALRLVPAIQVPVAADAVAAVAAEEGSPYVAGRQLYVMAADGSQLRCLSRDPRRAFGSPSWSGDGQWIAYDQWMAEEPFWRSGIGIVQPNGEGERMLGPGGMPSWLRSGTSLLAHTYPGEAGRIYSLSIESGERKEIVDHWSSNPCVSADGKRLAFVSRDQQIVIWDLGSLQNGAVSAITVRIPWSPLTGMSWSPDGQALACVRKGAAEPFELVQLRWGPEKQMAVDLLLKGDLGRVVAWHPGGREILLTRRERAGERYRVERFVFEDRTARPLEHGHEPLSFQELAWSPDGSQIVVAAEQVADDE